MEESEYTHPGLRLWRDSGTLHILLPVKAERWRRLLHFIWFGIWAAVEALLLAILLGGVKAPASAPPRPVLAALAAAFTLAGAFQLYRWLWYSAGREEFQVGPGGLVLRRALFGIGPARTIPRERIRSIRAQTLRYRVVYPSWGRPFIGHGNAELVVETDRRDLTVARGLEMNEARTLRDLMMQELNAPSQERRSPAVPRR